MVAWENQTMAGDPGHGELNTCIRNPQRDAQWPWDTPWWYHFMTVTYFQLSTMKCSFSFSHVQGSLPNTVENTVRQKQESLSPEVYTADENIWQIEWKDR